MRYAIILIIPLLLCHCQTQQHQQQRSQSMVLKKAYQHSIQATQSAWSSRELNKLLSLAFQRNPSLEQQRQRIIQAEQLAHVSFADRLPTATLDLNRTNVHGPIRTKNQFNLSITGQYEVDSWGKNRLEHQRQLGILKATKSDLSAAKLTLTAAIIQNWLRILAFREEISLLQQQIKTNQTILDLQKKRYQFGVANALDVLQQQETLASTQALLPSLKANHDLTEHQLAVLVGQPAHRKLSITSRRLPRLLPLPSHGLPIKLISHRPDILAAWQRVEAADLATAVAKRNQLPSVQLRQSLLSSATQLSPLLDNWLLSLVASLSQPLFNGGALAAITAQQASIADERFSSYVETVLIAIREVQDSLSQEYYLKQTRQALAQQIKAANAALMQAQTSYANGDRDYLNVLASLLSVQSLERQVIQIRRDIALNRVDLYRSLGGPWPFKEQHHANH